MATIFKAPDMTSGAAVKAIHAGVNSKVINFSVGAAVTRSGGATILMTELPKGARVQSGFLRWSANPGGTAGALVSVSDSLGNVYAESAVYATTVHLLGHGLGNRITGSANLIVRVTEVGEAPAATGSAALLCSIQYLAEDDGD